MLERAKLRYQALKKLSTKYIKQFPKRFVLYIALRSRYEKLSLNNDKFVISSELPPFPSKAFDRAIKALKSTTNGDIIPFYASFSITNKCVYDCWHCYINSLKEEDMSTEMALKIIGELQDLGVSVIALTGGEPLLRKDLTKIISEIDDRSSTVLFTTGHGLTKEKAIELKNAGLFIIIVGLEHSSPEIHDKLRGHKGAYDTALKAIKNAKEAGLYVGVATAATKERIKKGEIWDFIELAGKKGIDEVLILEPIPVGKLFEKEDSLLTKEERKQLIELQKNTNKTERYSRVISCPYRQSKNMAGCSAGYEYIHVSASGNICPCSFTPFSFGNAKKEDVKTIWKRMNDTFNKPHSHCFMLQNYRLIPKNRDDGFIHYEQAVQIYNNCPANKPPKLYKRLGVK